VTNNNRVRVKVCGMRDPAQVSQLVDLGVDAIGMIFYSKSARNVSLEQARAVRNVVPAFVSLVGVFVDMTVEEVNEVAKEAGLDLVQLHGNQDGEFASKLNIPYVRAIRVENSEVVESEISVHENARGFLLDTFSKDAFGGTGHRINDNLLINTDITRFILAGGINPENIEEVLKLQPYAIDINSGVETSPANKDIEKVKKILLAL